MNHKNHKEKIQLSCYAGNFNQQGSPLGEGINGV